MYLYNSKSNTHFLYHIHSETSKKELDYLINLFMPEGYNHAAIVPGNKHFYYVHENYLPKVYDAKRERLKLSVI